MKSGFSNGSAQAFGPAALVNGLRRNLILTTRRCLVAGLALGFLSNTWSSPSPLPAAKAGPSEAGSAISQFASLPLYFEENSGQADESVRFLARGSDHTVYLRAQGATIALKDEEVAQKGTSASPNRMGQTSSAVNLRLVHLRFPGSAVQPVVVPEEKTSGRINYLLGDNSSRWRTGVPTFGKVRYQKLYPGIDLVYYGNHQRLEYDFVVAPGADPSVIELHFDGADRLEIDPTGDLLLHVGRNQLRQHKPIVYQMSDGVRREVPGQYVLKGTKSVFFKLGRYDRSQTLVIDPVLSYSTYLGGKNDIGWAIAVDGNGSAFVAGETLTPLSNLPPPQDPDDFNGKAKYGGDAFVARLDNVPGGNSPQLGYLTYIGGNNLESASGIAVDSSGNAYVTGYTVSTNFPTFNNTAGTVWQSEISGKEVPGVDGEQGFGAPYPDAFVTKLDTSGEGVYSTYIGGELSDVGADIAVDPTGAAYVLGYANSVLTFVITNEVLTARCTNGVCGEPKVQRKITTASLLVPSQAYTNFLKTNVTASVTNIVYYLYTTNLISPLNAAPVSFGFPTANAIQTNNATASLFEPLFFRDEGTLKLLNEIQTGADLFVAKIAPDGSGPVYSTYLGGIADDFGTGIAVDATGAVTISGWTESDDLPVTNAIQSELLGTRDALIAKINPSGSGLVYLTYLGGSKTDAGYGVTVDSDGAAYMTGLNGSTDFPGTPGALNRGGIFASGDLGSNWTLSSSGLMHNTVNAFAADPSNIGTFYAGTPRGVFKSTDAGTTWIQMSSGLSNRVVLSLAVDPSNSSTVYAGTTVGLFTSTNGGLNWAGGDKITVMDGAIEVSTSANPGLPLKAVRAIHIEPSAPTNVFAGTASGIYLRTLSTNLVGHLWLARNNGLRNRSIYGLSSQSSLLFAATDGGFHVSTNQGTNWQAFNTGLKSTRTRSLAVDPTDSQIVYVGTLKGFHKTINQGTNWVNHTNGLNRPIVNAVALDPTTLSTVYAGTTNGLFISTDAGTNWLASNNGILTRDVSTLAFNPAAPGTLFAGTRGTNFAGGSNDVFLAKLAPDGSALDYALTFGGKANDEGWDVAVDSNGSAFVIGQTASKNFPVIGLITNLPASGAVASALPQPTNYHGRIDAFVARFDPAGSNMLFSFYLGGKKNDFGYGIATDDANGVYLVGRTQSSGFATNNPLQKVGGDPVSFAGGKQDTFVMKLVPEDPVSNIVLSPSGEQVEVSWRAPAPEFTLESRQAGGGDWTPVSQEPVIKNGRHTVVLPAATSSSFFRLRAGRVLPGQ